MCNFLSKIDVGVDKRSARCGSSVMVEDCHLNFFPWNTKIWLAIINLIYTGHSNWTRNIHYNKKFTIKYRSQHDNDRSSLLACVCGCLLLSSMPTTLCTALLVFFRLFCLSVAVVTPAIGWLLHHWSLAAMCSTQAQRLVHCALLSPSITYKMMYSFI